MINIKLLIPLSIFILSLFSCNNNKTVNNTILTDSQFITLNEYAEKKSKQRSYKVLNVISGNFVSTSDISYLVFLDDKDNNYHANISLLLVIEFNKDSSLKRVYKLDFPEDIYYSDDIIPEINNFGKKFNQGWIYDLNGNYLDEIFIFHGGNDGCETLLGYEFNGAEFQLVLPYLCGDARIKKIDKNKKAIYIRRITQLDAPDYSEIDGYDTIVEWNNTLGVYKERVLNYLSYDTDKQDYIIVK